MGWSDSFRLTWFPMVTVKRPPVAELKTVLDRLSVGFSMLQIQCVQSLLDKMTNRPSGQSGEEEWMQPLCEDMLAILYEAQGEIATKVPDFLPEFAWAFTWLSLPLLLRTSPQESASRVEKESIAVRWNVLTCLWPDDGTCSNTMYALDFFRRFALLECGHETQALSGYQTKSPLWRGFEECDLLCSLADKQYTMHCYDKAVEWMRLAQKSARSVPREHPNWSYIDLRLLSRQIKFLERARWLSEAAETKLRFLRQAGKVDLQLRADRSSPEGSRLSDLDKLKLLILEYQAEFIMEIGKNLRQGLRNPLPELTGGIWMGADEELQYHELRGKQLLILDRFEEGMKELHTVRSKVREVVQSSTGENNYYSSLDASCRVLMIRALDEQCKKDGVDRSEDRLTLNSRSTILPVVGSTKDQCTKISVLVFEYAIACTRYMAATTTVDDPMEFWEAWEGYQSTQHRCMEEVTKQLRIDKVAARDNCLAYTYSETHVSLPSFYALHIDQVRLRWLEAPPHVAKMGYLAYIDDLAHRALLYAERIRPSSVLLSDSALQPDGVQALQEFELEMIREFQKACGCGTSVFVQYLGYGLPLICLLDGGNVSFVWLKLTSEEIESLEKTCISIVTAMDWSAEALSRKEPRRLTDSEVMECLEDMYDLLIGPLNNKLIRPMLPNYKLVIVRTGCFAKVPFSILRNRQTQKYLFQEVTVSVTQSFRLLHQCGKRYKELQTWPLFGPGPGAAVALGDPSYKPPTEPLPGSGDEVKAISRLFNDGSVNSYQVHNLLQKEATIEGLLDWTVKKLNTVSADGTTRTQHSQGFLHIAAHARVSEIHPRGTLVLAGSGGIASCNNFKAGDQGASTSANGFPGGERDWQYSRPGPTMLGISQATRSRLVAMVEEDAELLVRASTTLDLNAGLLPSHWILSSGTQWSAYMVVLSACDSGTGQEEIFGSLNLGQAFLFRGIPCSVVTQWPVNDCTTAHLMQLFYQAMRKGEDASSALRSAMVSMLDTGRYALHQLAPFVVNGLPTVCLPPQLCEQSQPRPPID